MAALAPPIFRVSQAHSATVLYRTRAWRTNHVPFLVERHETVLLAGDADASHPCAIDFRRDLADHGVERRRPIARVLFHVTNRQAGNELVRRAASAITLFCSRSSTTALVLWCRSQFR